MRANRLIRGWIAATALVLVVPASASATRFAAPGGTGPATSCPRANPCEIHDAIEDATVVGDPDVALLPGTYNIGGNDLQINIAQTLRADQPSTRPRVVSNGAQTLEINIDGTVVSDIEFEATDPGGANFTVDADADAILDRIRVIGSGTNGQGLLLRSDHNTAAPTILRNSVVLQKVDSRPAVVLGGGPAITATQTIVNSTVVNAGAAPLAAIFANDSFGQSATTVRNTIVSSANACDVQAVNSSGADSASISVDHSALDLPGAGCSSGDGVVTLGAGNVTAAPLLAGLATGDPRQLPGSPTIDKGIADGAMGSLDFELQARTQGAAVDIGADEATDPASLFQLSKPAGKSKRKRSLEIQAICPVVRCGIAAAANLVLKGTSKQAGSSKVFKLENVNLSLPAGQQGTLTFTLPKKLFKRLQRAKKAKLNIAATAIDPVGFTGSAEIGVKFKKASKG